MPRRCVVYGCSNTADTDNDVFIYEIPFWDNNSPVAAKRREKWINFVQQKRQMDANAFVSCVLKTFYRRLLSVRFSYCGEVQDSETEKG